MKILTKYACATALTALGISGASADGSADGNAIAAPDEVVVEGKVLYSNQVNALKLPTPIVDVPQSATITTILEMFERGFDAIGDIARYTPGINTSQGEGHRDAIVFRGVRSTADFFVDGVRDDVQYYRSLYNLDQVEVLRGPNSLLFGRGGTGGIINRVTKKAEIGTEFGSADMSFDSFSAMDLAVDYNIQTGTNSALRLNIHSDKLDGDRDFYDGDRFGFTPTLKLKLSPQTTLDLSYEYADHERFIDRGIPTGADGRPVEALADVVFGDEDINTTTLEAHIWRAGLTSDMSDTLKANLAVSYSDFDKIYRNLYVADYLPGTNEVVIDGYLDPTSRESLTISANVIKAWDNHTWLLGAEIVDTENKNHRYNTNWSATSDDQATFAVTRPMRFTTTSASDPVAANTATSLDFTSSLNNSTVTDIEVTSVYFQDQIDLSDNLIVTLGGRFDNFDITIDDIKNGGSRTQSLDEFGPRGGLVYKPDNNSSVYVSYSESFLPRSGEQFKEMDALEALEDPDVFENTEIGYKYDSENATFSIAYFELESTRYDKANINAEQTEERDLEVDGIEIAYAGKINDKLSLSATFSDLDGDNSGQKAREIPEQTFTIWAAYQASAKLNLGLGVTHQGESHISDGSTAILPDYERVDLSLNYAVRDDMVLQFHVENLTDEVYFPHAHSTHQVSVGEPLNAKLALYKKF
ncbi:MAG TPA: TonB-dependent siderophore receptor [Rhodobiaceae bacterium]|nr:TonB-dependent siderophore receptor [Rhodobiaceae bacterium]